MGSIDYNELWTKFKFEYKEVLNSSTFFITYVEPSSVIFANDDIIVVLCQNSMAEKFFMKRFDSVLSVFTQIIGHECKLVFTTDKLKAEEYSNTYLKNEEVDLFEEFSSSSSFESNLISKYTFDTFVIGPNSLQAISVAKTVCENPGKVYNPVFIYGASGLGKTHILHAIGNEIHKNFPNKKILYVPTESFTTDYITAIQSNKMNEFRNKYRSVDVLLIDDIQFIANKSGTQEEFFNTFNDLYLREKQIVISSDCRVAEIKALADRLKTRFENGFNTCITPPDYETRYAIMKSKSENLDIDVDPDILDFISQAEINNVRELEGILNQFKLIASTGSRITEENAKDALKHFNISEIESIKEVDFEFIVDVVSRYFEVKIEDIKSRTKVKSVVLARHTVMYLAREFLGYSYQKIADEFGGMNHTSVLDGCNNVKTRYHSDDDVKRYIDALTNMINQ